MFLGKSVDGSKQPYRMGVVTKKSSEISQNRPFQVEMVDFYSEIDEGSATKFKRAYELG